jgi:hypothetical protein
MILTVAYAYLYRQVTRGTVGEKPLEVADYVFWLHNKITFRTF